MSTNRTDKIGIILTSIIHSLFIFINELYGPYALLSIVNNYLETICINHSIIANSTEEIKILNESLTNINFEQMYVSFSSLILNVEKLPDACHVDPSLEKLTNSGEWKFYGLFLMGRAVEKNIKSRLDVSHILYGIKDVWNVFITILKPGARILPHKSITKGLLRFMMPFDKQNLLLEIFPDTSHGETFGEMELEAKKSQSAKILLDREIIFDPTVIHSIHNQGSKWCMILVIDIIRPLKEFAFAVNRMSLGLAAKHQLIDYALKVAECIDI